jgi:hypothetical protein
MAGVIAALLTEATAAGLVIEADGNDLIIRGSARHRDLARQLLDQKPLVLQQLAFQRERAIQVRVDAFRPQVPLTGPIPFLAMTPTIARGCCLSCGDLLAEPDTQRCELCAEAARRVIAEVEQRRRERNP